MIAKVIRGRGFKGAVNYITNGTADAPHRVEWLDCQNLPTNEPTRAARMMAWTSLNADDLKRAWNAENVDAAVGLTGRKCARPVYHLILSWAPDERPDRAEMEAAAKAALKALGMSEHEHVIAAHKDGVARHLHVVANLVHPETGKAASLQNDRLRLQEWALGYERTQGQIRCAQREENFNKRAAGEPRGQRVIDFASRKRDRDMDAARINKRHEGAKTRSSPAPQANKQFSQAAEAQKLSRAATSVSSAFNNQHAVSSLCLRGDFSLASPSRDMKREYRQDHKALGALGNSEKQESALRAQFFVSSGLRGNHSTPFASAADIKAAQIARMDILRARHKTQWDAHRSDWGRAFEARRTALWEQQQQERTALKARLRDEGQRTYAAAREAVINEVKARYAAQWTYLKSTYKNQLDATYAPFRPRMPRFYWQGLRGSIKAARTNSYAALKVAQSAAMRQALDRFHTTMRPSGKTGDKKSSDTAWEALRARHTAERAALSAQIAREKNTARGNLIARQQQDRSDIQTRHRGEWQDFNRSRKAQQAVNGRAASAARRFNASAISPAEKQMRARARQQSASQKQSQTQRRKPRGRRLTPDGS